MKGITRLLIHNGTFVFTTLFLGTLQTSLWFLLFGDFPPPQLWLLPCYFLVLYARPVNSLILVQVIAIAVSSLTSLSAGLLGMTLLLLSLGILYFKGRIFWTGPSYFVLVAFVATFVFTPIHWMLSLLLESQPLAWPEFWPWIIGTFFTPIFAVPLYPALVFLDKILGSPSVAESRYEDA